MNRTTDLPPLPGAGAPRQPAQLPEKPAQLPKRPPRLPDLAERERIRRDHDTTLIVEAAAGTGKTTSVVSRVVEMVAAGTARIGQIAAITFTEKAAGELRLRIRQGLESRIEDEERDPDAGARRERLEVALSQLEEASIGTIHAFCATVLRERPIEAGVDPDFQILTDADQRAFFDRVFRRFVDRQLENPGPGIARLLRRSRNPAVSPLEVLREAGRRLLDYRPFEAPWKRRSWDAGTAVEDIVEKPGGSGDEEIPSLFMIEKLYRSLPKDPPGTRPNWLVRSMAAAADLGREIRVRDASSGRDVDWLEQALAELKVPGYSGRTPSGFRHARKWRDAFRARLLAFQQESNADLAALLREDLRGLIEDYEAAKQKAGMLDFDDLLLRTQGLLRDHAEVREELGGRLRHIVVDEYQDTDPMQTEIVLLLTAPEPPGGDWRAAIPVPGSLCLVGDPKQSIYRFRRADVAHYLEVKERLLANGAAEIRLTTNFRSVPAICDFVNRVMKPVFEEAPGLGGLARQVDYVPLHPSRESIRESIPLAAIPLAHAPYARQLEEQEPKAVADFVGGLLDSGFRVSQADKEGTRPVEPSDICLLFRRFRTYGRLVPQPYADALRDLGIPHSLAAVQTYIGSAELSFLRAALTAIEFPDDELSVYATLRGPLFAIPDQDLFLFRERHPEIRLRPARARLLELDDEAAPRSGTIDRTTERTGDRTPDPDRMDPAMDRAIRDGLAFLYRLHRRRTHQPIAVTLQQLLGRNRAETGFAFWNSPDQVLSNLRRLAEAARAFEAGGGLSFRAFVEQLAAEAENPDAGSAHAIDEDVSGVRIMTTHTAKGLEFPVVILCDGAFQRHGRASRVVNAERRLYACDLGSGIVPWDLIEGAPAEEAEDLAELDRLLYVSLTRARDLVAAPVAEGDFPRDSLLAPVAAALKPLRGRGGITPRVAEAGQPSAPGNARGGKPLWELLRKDSADGAPEEGKAAEAAFLARRTRALDEGRAPSRAVASATALAASSAALAAPGTVLAAPGTALAAPGTALAASSTALAAPGTEGGAAEVHQLATDPGRPRGVLFGELVHRVLERIPLDADEPAVRREAARTSREVERMSRELERPEELSTSVGAAVLGALGHPLLAEARRAEEHGRCYRELPLLHFENAAGPAAGSQPSQDRFETASTLEVEASDEGAAAPAPAGTRADGGDGPLLVEGVADLVFQPESGGPWTVVDFKTDSRTPDDPEFAAVEARYRRQVSLYARAVERATGQPAKSVLLYL